MCERVRDKERDVLIGLRIYMHIYFVRRCSFSGLLALVLVLVRISCKQKENKPMPYHTGFKTTTCVECGWNVHCPSHEMRCSVGKPNSAQKPKWKSNGNRIWIWISFQYLYLCLDLAFFCCECVLFTNTIFYIDIECARVTSTPVRPLFFHPFDLRLGLPCAWCIEFEFIAVKQEGENE